MSKSPAHAFSIDLAIKYGIHGAIILQHFQYWIQFNNKMKRNIKEGRTWMYQTRKEICAHFPYLTEKEIRGAIDRLVDLKVIIKGNFNKSKIDKTTWYAFEVETDFLNNVYDSPKGPLDVPKGPMHDDKRAKQYQILNTDTETILLPLTPSKGCPTDSPASKEEEEEINNRLKNRPSTCKPIASIAAWKMKVLKEIRIEKDFQSFDDGCFLEHKEEAHRFDMNKFGDWTVYACSKHVEFTSGSQLHIVSYCENDYGWRKKTEKFWGNNK